MREKKPDDKNEQKCRRCDEVRRIVLGPHVYRAPVIALNNIRVIVGERS